MVALAKKNGVSQLELTVMESNSRALSLYERKGFLAVASLPDAYRTSDGKSISQITMIKII
jgi:ribosomal protein S18 acetylase RimI-like enzyme